MTLLSVFLVFGIVVFALVIRRHLNDGVERWAAKRRAADDASRPLRYEDRERGARNLRDELREQRSRNRIS